MVLFGRCYIISLGRSELLGLFYFWRVIKEYAETLKLNTSSTVCKLEPLTQARGKPMVG